MFKEVYLAEGLISLLDLVIFLWLINQVEHKYSQ